MREIMIQNHYDFPFDSRHDKNSNDISKFQTLSNECCKCLEEKVNRRKYSKGEIIIWDFEENHGIFFILSGLVKLSKQDENGRELIISLKRKGDVFAESSLFNNRGNIYSNKATMIQTGEILFMDSSFIEKELKICPLLTEKIFRTMSEQIEEFSSRLFEMAHFDLYSKTMSTIEKLTNKFGKRLDDKIYIDLPITIQELSLLVGASRESTSRVFSKLKKNRLIEVKNKKIIILDLNKFRASYKY